MPRPQTNHTQLLQNLQQNSWKHPNGRVYDVLNLAVDDDNDGLLVIHQGQHDGRVWSRSLENFFGEHKSGVERFTPVITKAFQPGDQ